MSRYYYYLVLINMIANIIASVPAILLHFNKQGAVSSLIIALFAGTLIITLYTRFFNAYPGMTLPEMLRKTTSKWFYKPFLIFLAMVWYIAGLITFITFTFLLIRFLSPEMPIIQIGLSILIPAILGCFMKTDRVLYTVEIVLLITLPLVIFIFFKGYWSKQLKWDFIKEGVLYFNQLPNLFTLSACFYLFLGVANLFIFNRFFTNKQRFGIKQIFIVFIISLISLFTTFFIPIGFNGFEDINNLVYPWITTSDSLRMRFSLIERVLYVFLLFYLGIAFLSMLIHWHVCMEFLKEVFNLEKIKWKQKNIGLFLPIPFFIVISLYILVILNEYTLFRYSAFFYNTLIGVFPLLFLLLLYIKRRMKHVGQTKEN